MAHDGHALYDDGSIACDDTGVLVRRYYPWGSKRIAYSSLRGVKELPLTGANKVRRWRIWGSGDFVHWWNLDPGRIHKEMALVLETGGRVRPTITPDNPQEVERILRAHLGT